MRVRNYLCFVVKMVSFIIKFLVSLQIVVVNSDVSSFVLPNARSRGQLGGRFVCLSSLKLSLTYK